MMRFYKCRIEGTTDLMMNRFHDDLEGNGPSKRPTPSEEAERAVYRDNERKGQLYIPQAWLQQMLADVGQCFYDLNRSKVPAGVKVFEQNILLFYRHPWTPIMGYILDSRPVVMPRTRKRIMRHRPRVYQWGAEFHLKINEEILTPDDVRELLFTGGERFGIGAFRPQKGGPFGTFVITRWSEV